MRERVSWFSWPSPVGSVLRHGLACDEAAGAVQVLLALGVGDEKLGRDFLAAMRRTASMLTGLIQAQHRRRG